MVFYNVIAIITAVKHWENPCEASTAARQSPCKVRFRC